MAKKIVIGGVTYEVLEEKSFGIPNRTELSLRRPKGKRTFHAVRYEDGSISEAV